ncbi:MAG: asparagine synthase (glutamine-hydrolyzing) [Thermoanaerobaculia bacterium]
MCGIAGFLDPRPAIAPAEWPAILASMRNAIRHRGPDDEGDLIDRESGLGFAFRRLSIIDLSPLGHQPMESADRRYAIIFNGEIYNFEALRAELQALSHTFRGRSDTEVMLAAFTEWGVVEATRRFNGMFAYALWDRHEKALYLGRDRGGEKPLYYGWSGGVFLFGSELKALRAHPAFDASIDRDALAEYLRWGYIAHPQSIHTSVRKVVPGTIVRVPARERAEAEILPYWSLRAAAEAGCASPFQGTFNEAVDELERLLSDSVKLRMIADVPLGAFLSGGIDSSLIVSLMRQTSRVKTFSIGFTEAQYDEAPFARAVARHLGTDHTEAIVSPREAMDVIPGLPSMFDEPFGDSSQIPTHLVSRIARQSVTVALSGDAGDELFGGYNHYFWARTGLVPGPVRRLAGRGLESLSDEQWQSAYGAVSGLLPRRFRHLAAGQKILKLARVMRAPDERIYDAMVTQWSGNEVLGRTAPTDASDAVPACVTNPVEQMMFRELVTYLPGDILTKVDRASMAVSLETRVPMLDHRVIEFAWRLPLHWKIHGRTGKWILRRLLDRYVPPAFVDRPKMGFAVPIGEWLRGPFRGWAEALLDERRLQQEGFLDPGPIRQRWSEFLAGRGAWHNHLWSVLMFQAWLEETTRAARRPAA